MGAVPGRELFAERVDGTLDVSVGEGATVTLRVEEVEDFGAGDGTRFSVRLRGPAEPFLPQATYRVTVAGGQAFDLFLVPVAREADGYRYEAAFNRDTG